MFHVSFSRIFQPSIIHRATRHGCPARSLQGCDVGMAASSIAQWRLGQVGVHFSLGTKLLFLLLSKADPSLFYMYLHWKKHDAKPTQPNKTLWTQQYINSHLSGYVLFCALELVISRPPMVSALFPLMILFGLCYITFAWALYMRLGPENASSAMIHTLDREFQRDHWLLITFPPMT